MSMIIVMASIIMLLAIFQDKKQLRGPGLSMILTCYWVIAIQAGLGIGNNKIKTQGNPTTGEPPTFRFPNCEMETRVDCNQV